MCSITGQQKKFMQTERDKTVKKMLKPGDSAAIIFAKKDIHEQQGCS
jgi:hypothetical protein